MPSDRRSYSRVNPATGAIEWTDPETPSARPAPARRSRMETDDEVRARLYPHVKKMASFLPSTVSSSRGKGLDKWLAAYGLPPRQWVDE